MTNVVEKKKEFGAIFPDQFSDRSPRVLDRVYGICDVINLSYYAFL